MTFQPDIPRDPQDMAAGQAPLATNFTQLNTQFGVNHGAFNDSAIPGKHKFVTFVERSAGEVTALSPKSDEAILFAQDDGAGNTELYVKQYQEDPYQFTKGGAPFVGMKPVAAANFQKRVGTGAVTPDSSYNVASVNQDADGRFTITYTNQITDPAGSATADYYWTINGFDDSNNPVIGTPRVSGTYSDYVKATSIVVEFRNQNGTRITGLTRASVIIWAVQ